MAPILPQNCCLGQWAWKAFCFEKMVYRTVKYTQFAASRLKHAQTRRALRVWPQHLINIDCIKPHLQIWPQCCITEMLQHSSYCHELCLYCTQTHNAQEVFQTAPLWCRPFTSQSSRPLSKSRTVSVPTANPNSEITYSAAHGTVSAPVQAWREGREGGIRFTSPEIRHTRGAALIRPPPAVRAWCNGAPPLLLTTETLRGRLNLISSRREDHLCSLYNLINLIPKLNVHCAHFFGEYRVQTRCNNMLLIV